MKESMYVEDQSDTDFHSLIDEAIDRLPPRRRDVYLLNRRQGMSYNEIAALLNISRESVKTHLQLATSSITSFIKARLFTLVTGSFFFIIFFLSRSPFLLCCGVLSLEKPDSLTND